MTLTERIAEARRANAAADAERKHSESERMDRETQTEREHTADLGTNILGMPIYPDEVIVEDADRSDRMIGRFQCDGMIFQRYRSGLAWREPCPGCVGYILHQFQTVGDLARALDYAAANPGRRCLVCEENASAIKWAAPAAPPRTPTEKLVAALDRWLDARAGANDE